MAKTQYTIFGIPKSLWKNRSRLNWADKKKLSRWHLGNKFGRGNSVQEISVDENWADKSLVDDTRDFAYSTQLWWNLVLISGCLTKSKLDAGLKNVDVRLFR